MSRQLSPENEYNVPNQPRGDNRALLCTNFSLPLFLYTEFKKNLEWYVITINYSYYITGLIIIPMLLIINILFF